LADPAPATETTAAESPTDLSFIDDAGRTVSLTSPPSRVVSLSPAATEIILALGAGGALKGVSSEDGHFEGLIGLPVVGTPRVAAPDQILALEPDLLIVEPYLAAQALSGALAGSAQVMIVDGRGNLGQARERILALGHLFGQGEKAREVWAEQETFFETLALKTAKLKGSRQRVLRLVAREGRLSTFAEGSFQNEIVQLAGGLTPAIEAATVAAVAGEAPASGPTATTDEDAGAEEAPTTGSTAATGLAGEVPIDPAGIVLFDPGLIFACGKDRKALDALLAREDMAGIAAVKNFNVRYYPCALTDRSAAHQGYFAAWLSSAINPIEYGDPANLARPNAKIGEEPLAVDIPYVSKAAVVSARLNDYVQKTLVIEFKSPQTVISTGDGPKEGALAVGNGSSPPMVWDLNHQGGWEADVAERYALLGLDPKTTAMIFTGADLAGLVTVTKTYRDMTVTVLATAGAESNAVRTSKDVGAYYEPGTINVIVLSSRNLSPTGAARAMLTVTEAKTAAVWDLGVRSSQTPLENPATGTGTDSVIIVAGGQGQPIDYTGGHTKIGQLIGEAVHEAVIQALAKGNGLAQGRHVLTRLSERGLDPAELFGGPEAAALAPTDDFQTQTLRAIISPRGAALLEAALALDDALIMGQLSDPSAFEPLAQALATDLAGRPVKILDLADPSLPPCLRLALNAIGSGLAGTLP
jgi:adenosylcobinamide amidohydrolase/ABC-type Fe3+-hydroxamate transport system substrate-binding protein